jgi:hypothetical protein
MHDEREHCKPDNWQFSTPSPNRTWSELTGKNDGKKETRVTTRLDHIPEGSVRFWGLSCKMCLSPTIFTRITGAHFKPRRGSEQQGLQQRKRPHIKGSDRPRTRICLCGTRQMRHWVANSRVLEKRGEQGSAILKCRPWWAKRNIKLK